MSRRLCLVLQSFFLPSKAIHSSCPRISERHAPIALHEADSLTATFSLAARCFGRVAHSPSDTFATAPSWNSCGLHCAPPSLRHDCAFFCPVIRQPISRYPASRIATVSIDHAAVLKQRVSSSQIICTFWALCNVTPPSLFPQLRLFCVALTAPAFPPIAYIQILCTQTFKDYHHPPSQHASIAS